jgi:hypothetical protein
MNRTAVLGGNEMTIRAIDESQRRAARAAGLAYVLIIILSMLKLIFVGNLIVSGNNAATTNNIMANELLFRIGLANDIIVFVLVVFLSLALYVILKTVNKNLALLALLMRFGEGIIGGVVTVLSGLIPLLLLDGAAEFATEQLQALVALFLDVQTAGLNIVMIFMGVGGTVFCYLFFKSKCIPRILAAWGIVTYLTMLILSFVNILLPNLPEMIAIVLYTPGALFEIIIGLWLLFKGVDFQH